MVMYRAAVTSRIASVRDLYPQQGPSADEKLQLLWKVSVGSLKGDTFASLPRSWDD